jgi:EAL and modified HD-GYP domain-containing signal transduction protein
MFGSLLNRLTSGRRSTDVPAKAQPSAVAPAASTRVVDPPIGLGARRPLISPAGALAGFEFGASAAVLARARAGAGDAALHAGVTNVLGAMRLCIDQKFMALAELPAGGLTRFTRDGDFCPGMYIVVGPDPLFADSAAATGLFTRLRQAGARIGWARTSTTPIAEPPGTPDFVPVRLSPQADASAWKRAIDEETVRLANPRAALLLLDVEGVELMESLLHAPVLLAACAMSANLVPARIQALPPQAQRLLQLMSRLVRDDDTALLVADIKSDPTLALRLLQYLNSAGASPGRELGSIDQAVMVLGRNTLYRWVSQMLVRLSPSRPAADALRALTLARARLLERLARAAGESSPGSFYVLGLASMLPMLLQCSVDDATASLQLPAQALEALRQGTGPWQRYLSLALALERYDMAETEVLAQTFGGLEAVLSHAAQAWLPA